MNANRIAGVLAAAFALAPAALAFNPQPEPPAFGMVGLARTQTAMLNVVLTPVPEDGVNPPDDVRACRMVLSFVDARGQVFHDAAGNGATKRVLLRNGEADSLALGSRDILPGDQIRIPIRAVLGPVPDDSNPTPDDGAPVPEDGRPSDCRGLVATLEIIGPFGFTQVLYAPIPDDGTPVPNDGTPGGTR